MDWIKILSTKRLGRPGKSDDAPPQRTEFTQDYDRIIFSSVFQMRQDKTQVFPLALEQYQRIRGISLS